MSLPPIKPSETLAMNHTQLGAPTDQATSEQERASRKLPDAYILKRRQNQKANELLEPGVLERVGCVLEG